MKTIVPPAGRVTCYTQWFGEKVELVFDFSNRLLAGEVIQTRDVVLHRITSAGLVSVPTGVGGPVSPVNGTVVDDNKVKFTFKIAAPDVVGKYRVMVQAVCSTQELVSIAVINVKPYPTS